MQQQQQTKAQEKQHRFKKKWVNLEPVFTAILCNDKHGVSSALWMQSYTFATTLTHSFLNAYRAHI